MKNWKRQGKNHRKFSNGRSRFATVREKCLENEIYSRSGSFVDGQGHLERTWKVREKAVNLKINRYGRQSSENLSCSRGERVYFLMR